MGWFGKIFGATDIIKDGMNLIDEAWESAEEKTENKIALMSAKTNSKAELLKAYAPFKLTQRVLAFAFAGIFLFIMANGVMGLIYGVVDIENVNAAKAFANDMWLGEIVIVIIGFYFGGGLAESIKRKQT